VRIAFVTYEFAGVASGGGIGTYVRHAASMMAARDHQVEVFTAQAANRERQNGPLVHGLQCSRQEFPAQVARVFADRQRAAPFDVVEGPEFGADAAEVAKLCPGVPLVVKLHTPTFLINEMNHAYLPGVRKARYLLGALRRGRAPRPYWVYRPESDCERAHARAADEVTAPSRAILQLLKERWGLSEDRLAHVPHPFVPSAALLRSPVETMTNRVTFIGRLEARKGVIELAHAMASVLAKMPSARFRLVGASLPHPVSGEDMQLFMRKVAGRHADRIEFTGAVPAGEIPGYLKDTDVCVFPSVWEASGFVCKEAMAAARGVVASGGSGMAELVVDGETGRLVPPADHRALADAILELLKDPDRRTRLGRAARDYASSAHAPERIAPMQERSYERAIARAAARRESGP
jgi:glycosyltransferase involved in cell wall biosynthesis